MSPDYPNRLRFQHETRGLEGDSSRPAGPSGVESVLFLNNYTSVGVRLPSVATLPAWGRDFTSETSLLALGVSVRLVSTSLSPDL